MQDISQLIGHHIQRLDVVDSTNNYVANHIQEGKLSEGAVIMANFQRKGKGRNENSWQSQKGQNLMFSFFLSNSSIMANEQFRTQKWVCSAICAWLHEKKILAQIKLPNDIFIDSKKLAGILIENKWKGNVLKQSIIGIGINVNQESWEGNEDFVATSIKLETDINQNLDLCLEELCSFLSYYYSLSLQNPSKLNDLFHQFLINNCWVSYKESNKEKASMIQIKDDGICTVHLEKGEIIQSHIDEFKLHLSP